ncbi:MAG TPA: Holliday junction resolvase RuvX [Rhodocyclaceae bacterium]|nr:Holliday junction resolvase RuvX [Rhodocyclaceae bacterium]
MPEGGGIAAAATSGNRLALGFDFGTKRIGIAVGQEMLGTARPIATLTYLENAHRFAAIQKLIEEWHPDLLVVGLPMNVDGSEHEMSARCRRFANQLYGRFRLPVALVDERFSSVVAEESLAGRGMNWQERKAVVDAEAARLILESFFQGGAHEIYPPHQ